MKILTVRVLKYTLVRVSCASGIVTSRYRIFRHLKKIKAPINILQTQ